MGSNTLTNHGTKIPMPNPNLVETPMRCSWCLAELIDCKCPASLARSIDKERAEAIRERNELREQLACMTAPTPSDSTTLTPERRERMHRAFIATVMPWHKRNRTWYLEPEYVNVMFDAVFSATLTATLEGPEAKCSGSCGCNGDDPDCPVHGEGG